MKKYMYVLLIVCIGAMSAWADNDSGQAGNDKVRDRTRQMLNEGIPAETAQRMTRMMEENHFTQASIVSAQETVMAAAKEGLPAEAVMNKAFEGMAKMAPEQAIVQAMEKTRARYAYSYRHARQFSETKEKSKQIGNAMAECLAAGLTEKDMDRVMAQLRHRMNKTPQVEADQNLVEQSVFAARTMARMGVTSNAVGEVVCQALTHQYNAQDMETLQNRFREQAGTSSPAMLANTYAHAISQGMGSKGLGRANDTGSGGHGNGPGSGNSGGNSGGTSGGGTGGAGSGSGGGAGGSGGGHGGNGGGGHGR